MKKEVSFNLSEKARRVIAEKAVKFNINHHKVLESIILEFAPSTPEEKKMQIKNEHEALVGYFKNVSESTDENKIKAWRNGFINGWKQFQIRKKSSLFRTEE